MLASLKATNSPKWEAYWVATIMILFLALNLITATRYPFVWIDEVSYSDPAINLRMGHGFTSSAWYVQHSHEFWAGNVPLHPILLYFWITLFGDSVTAVRSINYAYVVLACLLFWRGVIRLELIQKSAYRLLLIAILLGGYSTIFSYRSGRPDCLPMCLVAALFYLYSAPPRWWRWTLIFLIGFATAWAGLQLAPMLLVGGVFLLTYLRRAIAHEIAVLWSGAAAGTVSLIAFYKGFGVFDRFLASIRGHTSVNAFSSLLHGTFRHSNHIPKDFSFVFLFAGAFLLALAAWKKHRLSWRSPLSFGIVYSATLTIALILSGKFPTYYGWMTYIPLAICFCATLSQCQFGSFERKMSLTLAAAAIAVSIFLHGVTAIYNWSDRNYAHVAKLIEGNVRPNDIMYGEFSTYYAAKKQAREIFTPFYLSAMLDSEKQRLTVLVVAPDELKRVVEVVGGSWAPTGAGYTPARSGFWENKIDMGFLSTRDYRLQVFRRSNEGAAVN